MSLVASSCITAIIIIFPLSFLILLWLVFLCSSLPIPVCMLIPKGVTCCVFKGTILRYEQLFRAVQVRRALPALLICLNCVHSEIWSSAVVTHCQNVCYIFHFNVWLDTVGVMPHKEGYSTKYVILQISNAAQNCGVLRYFSSLQHFLFWWLISKYTEFHSFLHTCKIVTFHSTSTMPKHAGSLYIEGPR